jgi:hypothetical protein
MNGPGVPMRSCGDLQPHAGRCGPSNRAEGPAPRLGKPIAGTPFLAGPRVSAASVRIGTPLQWMCSSVGVESDKLQSTRTGDAPNDLDIFVHVHLVTGALHHDQSPHPNLITGALDLGKPVPLVDGRRRVTARLPEHATTRACCDVGVTRRPRGGSCVRPMRGGAGR